MAQFILKKNICSLSDFDDIHGYPVLKRSMEICAAGMFHLLIFGPANFEVFRALHALYAISPDRQRLFLTQYVIWSESCSCGNLGLEDRICHCSPYVLKQYWKSFNGVYLRTFDMRVPVKPIDPTERVWGCYESNETIRLRVHRAIEIQEKRFFGKKFSRNSTIPGKFIKKYCKLDDEIKELFSKVVVKLSLDRKSCLSVLKIARTIADLKGSENIERDHFLEAVHYRRYGDHDLFWREV